MQVSNPKDFRAKLSYIGSDGIRTLDSKFLSNPSNSRLGQVQSAGDDWELFWADAASLIRLIL